MAGGQGELTWADHIGTLGAVRIQLDESDPECLYELTIPRLAATEDELADAEKRLGHVLDPQYREFLRYANCWPEFFYDTHLLGTHELGAGALWEHANVGLDAFYESLPAGHDFPPRHEIEPIAVNPHGRDLFAIWRTSPAQDGSYPVLWYPDDPEPMRDFFEFFAFVYQSCKEDLEELQQANQ